MKTFLFLFANVLFAELFQTVHPDKPGLYGVRILENGEREFVEIDETKMLGASQKPPAWDFRLVKDSLAIKNVFDQGQCGGCWAFSSADVVGASLYLNSNKTKNVIPSPQYMIDCHATRKIGSHTYQQEGCNGGYPVVAFADVQDNGLPTQECIPWVKYERSNCPTKCTNGSALNKQDNKDSNFHYIDAYKVSLQTLRNLVTTSGPCIAEMYAYDDLSQYVKGTVYRHTTGNNYEGHAVTVYGFGTQDGEDYWLIKNSWGSKWGDGGFFKILMGKNDSGIENNFYSMYNNSNDYLDTLVPRPTDQDSTHGSDWNEDGNTCAGLTENACKNGANLADCTWFTYDTSKSFCDWKDPKCEEFASTNCNDTWKWGLTDCVAGKYTCVERGTESECDGLTGTECAAEPGCRLYTTSDGVETCDLENAKCSWFNESKCTTDSAKLELKCTWNDTEGSCQSLSVFCRTLGGLMCRSPVGSASVCHWYDGGESGVGFCDVNEARCSWFTNEVSCQEDSPLYDSMVCEWIDGQCSSTVKMVIPLWTLFAMILIALIL